MARAPPHRHLLDNDNGTTSSAGPHSRPYGSEASFDTNMVIILAALLCALICALGLNSIVRCALRCTSRFVGVNHHRHHHQPHHQDREAHHIGVGCGGLKRSTIRQIPVIIYDSTCSSSPCYNKNNTNVDVISTDCIICLGEFVDGEKIRVLPKCRHGFHVRCIDTWLLSHSTCPTCRESLLELAGNGNGGNGGGQGQLASDRVSGDEAS